MDLTQQIEALIAKYACDGFLSGQRFGDVLFDVEDHIANFVGLSGSTRINNAVTEGLILWAEKTKGGTECLPTG